MFEAQVRPIKQSVASTSSTSSVPPTKALKAAKPPANPFAKRSTVIISSDEEDDPVNLTKDSEDEVEVLASTSGYVRPCVKPNPRKINLGSAPLNQSI